MFGVRVFVAQNICLLYLSISSCILMLCKFFGGNLEFLEGKLSPPEVPRINPARTMYCEATLASRSPSPRYQKSSRPCRPQLHQYPVLMFRWFIVVLMWRTMVNMVTTHTNLQRRSTVIEAKRASRKL